MKSPNHSLIWTILSSLLVLSSNIQVGRCDTFDLDKSYTCNDIFENQVDKYDNHYIKSSRDDNGLSYDTTCTVIFESSSSYRKLKVKLKYLDIKTCNTELKLYDSKYTSGTILKSFDCNSNKVTDTSPKYYTTTGKYLSLKLTSALSADVEIKFQVYRDDYEDSDADDNNWVGDLVTNIWAIVGGVIGGIVGLIIIISIVVCVCLSCKRQRRQHMQTTTVAYTNQLQPGTYPPPAMVYNNPGAYQPTAYNPGGYLPGSDPQGPPAPPHGVAVPQGPPVYSEPDALPPKY